MPFAPGFGSRNVSSKSATSTVGDLQLSKNAIELIKKSIVATTDGDSGRDEGCITVRSGEEAVNVVGGRGRCAGRTAWEASTGSTTTSSRTTILKGTQSSTGRWEKRTR